MEPESHDYLQLIEPPQRLLPTILARLEQAALRRARMTLALLGMLAVASGGLLAAALSYAGQEMYASGFFEYVSLLGDTGARTQWQDIAESLLAAMPSAAILVILACLVALIWSVLSMPRIARVVRSRASYA